MKTDRMKHFNLMVVFALLFKSNIGLAKQLASETSDTSINSSEQIGNSYFKSLLTKPISQLGGALEAHQNSAAFYVFFNQLTTNHIFYELRAYGIDNNITNYLPSSSASPAITSSASPAITSAATVHNPAGFGGAGILGYNINVTPNVSMLPFIRGQALVNTFVAYTDSFGNQMGSVDYSGSIGSKLSLRITDVFAVYTLGFVGYQWSPISGQGVFKNSGQADANVYIAGLEFAAPYKIYRSLSITPYAQLIFDAVNPNQAASDLIYPFSQSNDLSLDFGIKLGYDF